MNIPNIETIQQMTVEERADLIGWLRVEQRAATQRATEATRVEERLCAQVRQASAEAREHRDHATNCGLTLRNPALAPVVKAEG